jgi:hypothetical protein
VRRTLCLLAAVVLAGCGEAPREPFVATQAAEPQRAQLGWRESYPASGKRLIFVVEELEITEDGWRAAIAVENETGVPFAHDENLTYGVMLFRTADLGELEAAAAAGGLPPVREAAQIEPPPPAVLQAGSSWRARLSSRGALPSGAHLRVVFGPLRAVGDPPEGIEPVVVWITDRSQPL